MACFYSRYMYWTDYGDNALVARAGMDGSNMIKIAKEEEALFPTGLAIDYEGKS